jgi:hypothetical protein
MHLRWSSKVEQLPVPTQLRLHHGAVEEAPAVAASTVGYDPSSRITIEKPMASMQRETSAHLDGRDKKP